MANVTLSLSSEAYLEIVGHLLRADSDNEEAAFAFARFTVEQRQSRLLVSEFELVRAEDFAVRSPWFLELRDGVRGRVIKRAHDLDACIVEFHSHPGGIARFSWSDKAGLCEFVPQVRWRLRGRPYGAVVVAPGDCDGVVWVDTDNAPGPIDSIVTGGQAIRPSGWSSRNWKQIDDGRYPL